MRGPRTADHVPGPIGARRVHRQEPDQAPARGLPERVGKTVHAAGDVQPTGPDRPQPEHVDLGQSRARTGHRQRRQRIPGPHGHGRRHRVAVAGSDVVQPIND